MVSQPTVSDRIARLERCVGAELFVRGPRGVSLTQAGDRLLPMASRIVGLMEAAVDAVQAADQPPPFRVGVHSTFAYRAVPLVLSALASPTRGVRVRDAHSEEMASRCCSTVSSTPDSFSLAPDLRPFASSHFRPTPSSACALAAHELASTRSVPVGSVVQHDVALNLWGLGSSEFEALVAPLTATGRRVECSDAGTALQLAMYHGYVAFVVHSAVQAEVAAGALKMLTVRGLPSWSVRLVLASRTKGEVDGDVESLRRFARQLDVP